MPAIGKKHKWKKMVLSYCGLIIGAFLVAVGLEIFLVPNKVIDGGVVGVAIMLNATTPLSFSMGVVLLNLPFMFLGYKHIGGVFTIKTLLSVILLGYFSYLLHDIDPLTRDSLLATVFGGIVLGLGVGTIIRNGGSLDGTEIVAILSSKKLGFSVGEIVMFFNIFILSSAGLVFSWESAMYSLMAYFIAFKVIDVVVEGLNESKSVTIISDSSAAISEAIQTGLGRGVTHIYGKGGYTQEDKELLYCIVTRLEVAKLKAIVEDIDSEAFVAIEHVHDVMGGRFKKKSVH